MTCLNYKKKKNVFFFRLSPPGIPGRPLLFSVFSSTDWKFLPQNCNCNWRTKKRCTVLARCISLNVWSNNGLSTNCLPKFSTIGEVQHLSIASKWILLLNHTPSERYLVNRKKRMFIISFTFKRRRQGISSLDSPSKCYADCCFVPMRNS